MQKNRPLVSESKTVSGCRGLSILLPVVIVILVVAVVLVVLSVLIVLLIIVLAVVLVVLVVLIVLVVLVVLVVIHVFTSHVITSIVCLAFGKLYIVIQSQKEEDVSMLLIQNGLLYTMEADRPFYADLLINAGKIAKIAENIPPAENMQILNAEGMRIFPGFIDAHSHIGIAEEKTTGQGDASNEGTNPITPCLRAIDAVNPMDSAFHNALAAGITGVMVGPGSANAIGGQFAFIKTDGRRIDDMIVLAPAAIKLAFGENPMTNYGINGNIPSTRMSIASLIREELFLAQQYFAGNENEQKTFGMECYRPLFEGKIPLKAHVHRADDIFTAIRIAKEFGLGLTLDHCTEGHLIAEEIAESGFPAIVGPSLASRTKKEVSLSDFKTPGVLRKAGVRVALTTDHPVSRIQYLPLCAALSAKEGLGEWDALRAITIDAARICRVDHRLGSLTVGKDADLAIYDGSPLEIASSVRATIISGKIVWPK